MTPSALQMIVATISSFFMNPCSSDQYESPSRSRSRKTKRITCNQYPRRLYTQLEMAQTTRRRIRLMSAGEDGGVGEKDEVMNVTIDPASQLGSPVKEETSRSAHVNFETPKKDSPKKEGEDPAPSLAISLKQSTLSMEMTEAIEALYRAEEAEQLLTPSSIKENDSDLNSEDVEGTKDISTPTPTTMIKALHRLENEDAGIFSSDEASRDNEDDDDDGDEKDDGELEIVIPDSKPKLSTAITTLSTPPASPAIGLRPTTTTTTAYILHHEPWSIDYICYECEQPVGIRGGESGIHDPEAGMTTDSMRCRECGCRMLWKKRTDKIVQFEAR